MPTRTRPASEYDVGKWLNKPFELKDRAEDDTPYDKYLFQPGEDLESIARVMSKPWKKLKGSDIAVFNWGTAVPEELNWYFKAHLNCKDATPDDKSYVLGSAQMNKYVWVPRILHDAKGAYRSPGRKDVGHVALEDGEKGSDLHLNTLVIRPVYSIKLELGDLDALFDDIGAGGNPWDSKGVQQRLQVLGYLYTPLGHSKVKNHAKLCWEYYKKLHTPDGKPAPTDAALLATLMKEVRNNILGVASAFLTKGQMMDGRLPNAEVPEVKPAPDPSDPSGATMTPGTPKVDEEFGMLRFPGGYCYNYPRIGNKPKSGDPAPSDDDAKYDFKLTGGHRHKMEEVLKKDNELLGKIPLIATVHRIHPDGRSEPAESVSVYFQLIDPTKLEDTNFLKAPKLRDKEMDYSNNWKTAGPAPGLYEVSDAGPWKFVDNAYKNQTATDTDDPQRENVDRDYNGKRRIPVEGEGSGTTAVEGVFEVKDTKRDGFHERRSDKHADYGTMTPAKKVTPVTENGKTYHKHAVKAKTNDRGHAGVIFMPSTVGGDRYKIRAYVGPETLEFTGDDPKGPVVETGTMVVWRNIRLRQYYQQSIPTMGNVSPTITGMLAQIGDTGWDTPAKLWSNAKLAAGLPTVDSDGPMMRNDREVPDSTSANYLKYYRPVTVNVLTLREQYKRCYCEFIFDGSTYPEPLTDALHSAAIAACRKAAQDSGEVAKAVNWDQLVLHDSTSPLFVNIRSRADYNANRGSGFPSLTTSDAAAINKALGSHGTYAITESLSGGGVLPGLTMIQSPRGDILSVAWGGSNLYTSGVGQSSRGCCLFYTNGTYNAVTFCYNVTANAAHELGHVLLRQHQPPDPGGAGHETQTGRGAAPASTCVCVMSYRGCYGEYCGRCVLALRGWKTKLSGGDEGI